MTGPQILKEIRNVAETVPIAVDLDVYRETNRDSTEPILYAGRLDAPVAFFARDLGRDEVAFAQPLIGGAGKRVRRAVHRFLFHEEPAPGDRYLNHALERILLTNTVPYKPVGNKAYPPSVRERLRPFIAAFLCCCWKGSYLITLGTEAFKWFEPYADSGEIEAFWKLPDRYERQIQVELTAECDGESCEKRVTLAPLPHPSPLNRTYLEAFPALLLSRLEQSPLREERAKSELP